MKCSDIQSNLALYADGAVGGFESDAVGSHLDACPMCRHRYADLNEIRTGLRKMRRPDISAALKNSIKRNIHAEFQTTQKSWLPFTPDIREWLMTRLMPYGVGVLASLLIGITFLTMMLSGILQPEIARNSMGGGDISFMLAANRDPYLQTDPAEISPIDYANARIGFGSESPSINPRGTLVALTRSLVRNRTRGDEVVVVADVFGNGQAQIAEVVEPSRDSRAVSELEKALGSDPSDAPFVPASMENRPESVRVVLKFQTVDVSTRAKPIRHQL